MNVKDEKEKLKREIINSLTYFEHTYNQLVRINNIINE